MSVVVTGGLGALGTEVVTHLEQLGHEAVVASRRTGVDLTVDGELDPVLLGAGAVVHTADTTSPRDYQAVTVGATRSVLAAAGRMPVPPHVVTISICGVDDHPYPYYRAKAEADQLALSSEVPATVVRATQFHSLAAFFARVSTVGPTAFTISGMRIRPVDIGWVGGRLAEIAVGPRPAEARLGPVLTGPQEYFMTEIAALLARHAGRRPPLALGIPAIGGIMKAFAGGTILPDADAEVGGERFEEWLARQPRTPRGR